MFLIIGCNKTSNYSYKNDLELIKTHTDYIELTENKGKARLIICPQYQGKIITSTHSGINGSSNGWLNRGAINKQNLNGKGIGGEDRIWIGPLGGQFSFYFQQIKPLNEENWQVPSALENKTFNEISKTDTQVWLENTMELTNFQGTTLKLNLKRHISILDKKRIEENLKFKLNASIDFVAYNSSHTLKNIDSIGWKKETGLASIWSAGMFEGSDNTSVIIPLKNNGSMTNIYKYLGPLNTNRLYTKGKTLLYKTDGKYRSKIGVPHKFAPEIYGCYSKDKKRLTIIQYQKTNDSLFFNSDVSIQKAPYDGEVIPIYNNGTMDFSATNDISFFELESTSAMRELQPNETIKHFHRVYHFSGNFNDLNAISKTLLNFDLNEIK
ncbi:DUF6786 family protein [Flavivirga rizhaonensis]|uniref:DUF4380 domain-containing protein n=1 Tax=Flavivirga rizhaonensis TaxID=2559571 RepID=A0A4S1DWU2_9FLAO|nr:DUF6786 family protein [Flavivirga rizhaonensis]TGV02610.1 hypothetical protein EM932_10580 [Flavivirga rizhaonensis]